MATGRTEAKPGGRKGTMSLSSDRSLRGPTQSCTFRDRTHTPQSRGAGGGQEHGQSRTQQPTVQAEGAAAIAEAVRLTSLPGRRPSSPSNLRLLSKRGSSLAVRGPPKPSDLHQHASKGSHSPLTGSGGSGRPPCPPEALAENPLPLSSSAHGPSLHLQRQPRASSNLSLCPHHRFTSCPLFVAVNSCFSPVRLLVMAFKAHPANPA